MTRRELLASGLAGAVTLAARGKAMAEARTIRESVDHLLLGARDLDEGIAWLDARTGVKAQPGGSHPGVGTRNALVSLGGRQYLEIIAPDPAQTAFNFNLDLRALPSPRLVTWAVSTPDVDAAAAAARRHGLEVFGPRDGSRTRPDGSVLQWRSAGVRASFAEADVDPVPFFIEWASSSHHPSSDAPAGMPAGGPRDRGTRPCEAEGGAGESWRRRDRGEGRARAVERHARHAEGQGDVGIGRG